MGEILPTKTRPLIPHLHLHLEPEERKRLSSGIDRKTYTDRNIFFRSHELSAPDRAWVSGSDLATFLRDLHAEQRMQGVDYVELRLSPRRFLADGMSWEDFLWTSNTLLEVFESPEIRAILLVNRDSSDGFIDQCRQRVIDGLPPTYVGLDLAGDEIRFPDVSRFRPIFDLSGSAGLGVTAHAGEFGDAAHVWRALDELGARRVGHAVSAARSRSLLRRLSDDRVLIEASISSNNTLRGTPDSKVHPCTTFLENSVPICLNADIPIHSGYTLEDELALAAEALGLEMKQILEIQGRALAYAFADFDAEAIC
jgi:adenosine deaminase